MPAAGPSGPRPFSTHGIAVDGETAVKRFRSPAGGERWLYGDEPRREWRALKLLAHYAPGLAPRPIRAELDADPPLIAMSRVPGEPLGTRPVTRAQEDAIAAALSRLHHAIPPSVLETVELAPDSPRLLPARTRAMARACDTGMLDPQPRQAYRAALAWLDGGWAERFAPAAGHQVFAQGDPNLANHLWDGHDVRLVDFERSGRGDRVTELADFVEHVVVWAHAGIDADAFLDRFDLDRAERQQLRQLRRLFAAFWVMRLLPGGSAYHRNPGGTFERQASRLLDLLGSARAPDLSSAGRRAAGRAPVLYGGPMPSVKQFQVTFDCAEPERVARFWCEVLGYVVPPPPEGFATWDDFNHTLPPEDQGSWFACVDPTGVGPRLFFQRVPEGKVVKNRLHLDVRAGTGLVGEERLAALEAECARLIPLGAVRVRLLPADEENESCLVMQDIEGNEFCLD